MRYLLLVLLLTGCSTTVPVTAKFPEVPNELLQKCPALKQLEEEVKLSDVAKNITYNYTTYHECVIKYDAWIEWYQSQKKIFESVK
jgi:hypothetical protein